jgi:hypothetical protein
MALVIEQCRAPLHQDLELEEEISPRELNEHPCLKARIALADEGL